MDGHKIALGLVLFLSVQAQGGDYLPPPGDAWATHTPAQEGIDGAKLRAAIDFAVVHETKLTPVLDGVIDQRDLRITIPLQFAKEPFSDPIGPLAPHAPANGIVIRHGYLVAEWGDTHAVDMTHSATKTFLSSVAGIAFDRHMIRDVNDRVIDWTPLKTSLNDRASLSDHERSGIGTRTNRIQTAFVHQRGSDRGGF